ncbi:hypothetical protein CS022_01590 [Veronia nyctiphanis]|uniref:DUF945 domain-containing protein n=1 Tax=Veronia nyctiphanis TaxID=1278244 RepID=A0A4Q0YUG7_9GAMM|nr:DUF945 family protein [Veronia nyctiphanis]RXJ74910.1 hypothetical protein CS022_01590 [Veronia nyctiphanis]
MIFGKYAAIGGGVALVALWPFAMGQIGQSAYEEELKNINQPEFSVSNLSYERGYLSSTAVTKIDMTGQVKQTLIEEGLPTSYTLNHTIEHGLTGVESTTVLDMTPELKDITRVVWGNEKSPILIKQKTSITGSTNVDMTVDGFNGNEDGFSVTSKPLVMKGQFDKNFNGTFTYNMESLDAVSNTGESLKMTGFSGTGNGYIDAGMWIGTQDLNLSSISFDGDLESTFALDGLAVSISNQFSDVKEAEATRTVVNSDNLIKVKGFTAPTSGFELKGLEFGFGAEGLDKDAVLKLYELSNTMVGEPSDMEMVSMMHTLDTLIEKGMKVSFSPAKIQLPQGETSVDIKLDVAPGIENATQNIQQLLDKLGGKISASIPTALVNMEPSATYFLNELASMGFVEEKGAFTEINATLKGEVLVSPTGKEFPLAYFAQLAM